MNYFPNGVEEISLLKFIATFEYLNEKDTKYFFKSKNYYRKRLASLVEKKYIRKIKTNYILDEIGIEYVKLLNMNYTKINRNKSYLPRLLYISHIAAFYYCCNNVKFTPSFNMKNKERITTTARKFIGVLQIDGIEYLTYHISNRHDNKYIASVIYDIQKEKNYRNIIVFVNNINRFKLNDFAFGNNQVLLIEDTDENKERLKYMYNIKWSKVIEDFYNNNVYLAEYNFCDYTDYKNKYVSTFDFLDTEKINRIKYFVSENLNRKVDIICSKELHPIIRKEIPSANFIIIDLDKYIEKERRYYD